MKTWPNEGDDRLAILPRLQQVLRRVLLLQEGTEVIVADGVLEELPTAEGPAPDASLRHLTTKKGEKKQEHA